MSLATIPTALVSAIGPEERWPLLWLFWQSAQRNHQPIPVTYAQLALAWECSVQQARTRLDRLADLGALQVHTRTQGKRRIGLTLHVWRPDPAPPSQTPPPTRRAPRPPQAQERIPAEPKGPPLPAWAKARRGEKVSRRELALAVTAVVDAIAHPDKPPRDGNPTGDRRGPWASQTDAKSVLSLWRASCEPLPEFVVTMRQIAIWARESDGGMARSDIRGEGRHDGVDRSRSVGTLCRHERYSDRKRAAHHFHRQRRPEQPNHGPEPTPVSMRDRR